MNLFLGVDCGATNLRVGVVDEEGNLIKHAQVLSPLKTNPEDLAKIVKDEPALQGLAWEAIGVGVPGPLDMDQGLILPSANLGNIAPINIKKQFELVFNLKVCLDRDTNLALLGEDWKGGAQGLKDVIMLTLGSGVGGSIMIDGKIERGEKGRAGEIGHMYLWTDFDIPQSVTKVNQQNRPLQTIPLCGLGHHGCLEALINSAKDLDELATYLGFGLANIVDIFNPQKIIIGGGKIKYSLSADWRSDFLPKAIAVMKKNGMKPGVDELTVEYAKLGEWSGVYGAAKLVMDSLSIKYD